jgi:T5SS/PEP-CTERM-associated repeat protein/autotransporter-associated beta strand protein
LIARWRSPWLAAALALSGIVPEMEAATITWGTATTISADTDVSTNGTFVGAANPAYPGYGSTTTVNGVTFTFWGVDTAASSGIFSFGTTISTNAYTLSAAPFGSLTSAYQALVRSGVAPSSLPLTLTISGLTDGANYEFQFWTNRSSGISSSLTATAGNSVNLIANTPGVEGSLGQYVIGTFAATGTTQTVDFSGSAPWINGLQLRLLTITAFWKGDQDGVWTTNLAGDTNWATAGDGLTDSGVIPGVSTDVVFSASGATNQDTTLGADLTIHSLTIQDAAAVTVGGANTLTISGAAGTGIDVQAGAGLFTLSANLTLAGASDTITVNNDAGALISGVIDGGNGLTKEGTGLLTLTGANIYTGGTTINGGILKLGNGTTLGAAVGTGDVTVNVGGTFTLDLANGETFANTIVDDGVVIFDDAPLNNYTVSSDISGSGILRKEGGNTVTYTGTATYTGDTFIEGGELIVTGSIGNTDQFYVGYDNGGTKLTISGGGTVTSQDGLIGFKPTSTGNTAVVTGTGSKWTVTGDLNVGFEGGSNTLSVEAGGAVEADYTKIGGYTTSADNTLTVTGTGSTLKNTNDILVGYAGTGNALKIEAGGQATNVNAFIGYQSTADNNTATVTGTGSLWTNTGAMHIGYDGSGNTLTASAGGKVTSTLDALIGFNAGSDDNKLTVTGAGSQFTGSAALYVGNGGSDNTLEVLDGGVVTSVLGRMGALAGSDGNFAKIDGTGSLWDISGTLRVGGAGSDNSISVLNGGELKVGGNSFLGYASTSGGNSVLVSGANSRWTANAVFIGRDGGLDALNNVNTVTVEEGGTLSASAITIAQNAGSAGQLVIDGTVAGVVSTSTITGGLGAAAVYFSHEAAGYNFAPTLAGSLAVTHDGTGETIFDHANTYSGGTTIAAGTLKTQNASALGTGNVALNGGTLAVEGNLNLNSAGQTLTWAAGQISLRPVVGDQVTVDTLTKGVGGGAFVIDAVNLQPITYTLIDFTTNTNFVQSDFSATFLNAGGGVTFNTQFLLTSGEVQLTILGATATGPLLQNSAPVNIPTFADFIVSGPVQTGGPGENNTVRSLTFLPGGSLEVFNTLYVTHNPVTLVGGSSLHLNDSTLLASQLNVLLGGLLHGNGTIDGSLYNAGLVSPGNSPGEIYVTGNYQQSSSGRLRIEVGGKKRGQYDVLAVDGYAQLDGTLELVRRGKYQPRRGDKVTFLTAGEGVRGEFAAVDNEFTSETILEPTVTYQENSVSLEVVRGSFEDFADRAGLTPNQRAVAGALDGVSADEPNDQALTYLDERKLNELPGDFDRIAPEELTSIFTISTSLANVQGLNLQRRTDDLRSGASGFSASGLAMQGTGPGYSGSWTGAAGPSGKESKEVKEVAPLDEKKWGVFLTGVGEWVDVSGDGNARGYDITTGGFTLGLDYKVCPNFAVGIAAGYAGTAADLTDDGRVWVNGGKLGIYATTFVGGWYADTAVTGGYNSYDTKRTALQGTARGSTDGGELNVLVGTGYDWKLGALSIGPTATFQYTLTGIDGFTEHGSLAPLEIAGRNAESIRSALGFKASYDWRVGGVLIKPEIRAAWQHEYGDKSYDLSASFASGAGNSFLVNGPETGRDSLLLGAGFAIQCSERFSTYLYYDGELARERYDRHSVSGGVRVAF